MSAVIKVCGLGKRYKINENHGTSMTLREAVMRVVTKPMRLLSYGTRGESKGGGAPGEELWALQEVDFEAHPGDIVGIIGRNGAGKSTLLKILSRITDPTRGFVKVEGRVGSLLEVGTGFHPELSGRENIYLNGAIIGMRKAEIDRKFDAIVDFSGVEDFLDTPVKHYSSGMYVRLAFAVSSHLDPDVLLVDEVLAVGDAGFQKKCLDKMREVTRSGRTVLFVSHNINAVASLCNKGVYLEGGRLVPTRNFEECLSLYAGQYAEEASSEWEGDLGDETLRFYKFEISTDDSRKNIFGRGERFSLKLEYEVLQSSPQIVVGVDILSSTGVFLCASRLTDVLPPEHREIIQKRGRHEVRLEIDTSIFADGDYLIKANFGVHNYKRIIDDEPLLSFKVLNPEKNFDHESPLYTNIVFPEWKWNVG